MQAIASDFRSSPTTGTLTRRMLSILSGTGFTLALLIGFAEFQKPKLVDQKVAMEDLKEATFA
ncbi:MAG: hypothetical protein WC378_14770, partial [Opitutaceae bacterium]